MLFLFLLCSDCGVGKHYIMRQSSSDSIFEKRNSSGFLGRPWAAPKGPDFCFCGTALSRLLGPDAVSGLLTHARAGIWTDAGSRVHCLMEKKIPFRETLII